MRDPLTTIFGALAAACGALATLATLPEPWHQVATGAALIFGAVTAFFAKDRSPAVGALRPLAGVLAVLAVIAIASGCTISAFRLGLRSPAFGSLNVQIGGGSLGRTNQQDTLNPHHNPTTTNTQPKKAP